MWNKRSADFSGSVLSVSVNQQPQGGCFALSDILWILQMHKDMNAMLPCVRMSGMHWVSNLGGMIPFYCLVVGTSQGEMFREARGRMPLKCLGLRMLLYAVFQF